MDALATLIIFIPAALIAFWLWMFLDMLHNPSIPSSSTAGFHWPPGTKSDWLVFFVVFSIFTAGYYCSTVYREK